MAGRPPAPPPLSAVHFPPGSPLAPAPAWRPAAALAAAAGAPVVDALPRAWVPGATGAFHDAKWRGAQVQADNWGRTFFIATPPPAEPITFKSGSLAGSRIALTICAQAEPGIKYRGAVNKNK